MKVTLLVYAKNEVESMPRVMPQIKKEWCDQIVVIDGGSTDGTIEYSRSQGYEVYVQNGGWWQEAYSEGHKLAQGDIIVDFSPDGNSKPELIPVLAEKIRQGYDMAVASRYMAGAKSEDDTLLTRFGNFCFTQLINLLFGSKYTDSLVIFRAYRKSLLKEIGMDQSLGDTVTVQISVRCAKFKKRVIDVPADEPKRIGGRTKMNAFRDSLVGLICIFKELFFHPPKPQR